MLDKFGQDIAAGDVVVYPVRDKTMAIALRVGLVRWLVPPKNFPVIAYVDEHRLPRPHKTVGRQTTHRHPERILVVPPGIVSREYLALLENITYYVEEEPADEDTPAGLP